MRPVIVPTTCSPYDFNPRTPCGVRLATLFGIRLTLLFQSTHPLRGATYFVMLRELPRDISIHAPLAGCDYCRRWEYRTTSNFNPRTPCGVRLPAARPCSRKGYFNPRTPCGVRQLFHRFGIVSVNFQSTHPLRGATTCKISCVKMCAISIHAPLAGCDYYFAL